MAETLSQINIVLNADSAEYVRRLAQAQSQTKKAGKAMNDSFTQIARSSGMTAVQISQFTGQIQGGTNALLALSQQAADIGFAFGPIGIAVGAATSLMAGFALAVSGVGDSQEQLEDTIRETTERIREQADELGYITAAQREFLSLVSRGEISELEKEYTLVSAKLEQLNMVTRRAGEITAEQDKEFTRLRATASTLERRINNLKEANESYNNSSDDSIEAQNKRFESDKKLLNGLRERLRLTTLSDKQQYIANEVAKLSIDATSSQIETTKDLSGQLWEKAKAQEAATKAAMEAKQAEEEQKRLNESAGQATINLLSKTSALKAKAIEDDRERLLEQQEIEREAFEQRYGAAENFHSLTQALEMKHAEERKQLDDRQVQEAAEREQKIAELTVQMYSQLSSSLQMAFGQIAEKNKGVAAALFLSQKALAFAQATIDGAAAIVKANSVDPTGALSARQAAINSVQLGVIAGTAIGGVATGQFHGGTDSVPESMNNKSFLLKAGERVVQPEANKKLTSFLDNQGSNGSGSQPVVVNQNNTFSGVYDQAQMQAMLAKNSTTVAALVHKEQRKRPNQRGFAR